jgi:hypothetical protein
MAAPASRVVIRVARPISVLGEFLVGVEIVAGQSLRENKRLQRGLTQDFAC